MSNSTPSSTIAYRLPALTRDLDSGFNRTASSRRAGIFAFYTLPIYMPQENWFLSLNPAVRHYASETLLQLFGFRAARFGRFYGASPY
jgi:hypothetical protein